MGTRSLAFTNELYIDRNDFMEEPIKGFKRLIPGGEVRLRNAYVIRCDEIIKDAHGEIIELHCTHDPATLGANPEGRKVKGVIHWVSARHAVAAEVRLYDRLFSRPAPDSAGEGKDYRDYLNADSLKTLTGCYLEPALAKAVAGENVQFEREGYFCLDGNNSTTTALVFNRTVTLRDSWTKIERQHKG
jgi:glutaminyl-tRNA synthetase